MKKLAKKLACAVLAGTMGLSMLAGCGSDKIDGTKPLITGGEETITIRTGNLMLRMNQAQMASYYAMMGGSTAGMWEQDAGNGKTYADTTKESVTDQLKTMVLLKQHAKDYDVTVSEEEKKSIEEAAKAFTEANDKAILEKLAVTQADVEMLLELYTYQNKMYAPMTADVDTNVEDSEAAQSKITYCRVDTGDKQNEDGTTTPLTDEEKKAKKNQAQAVLDKVKAAEDTGAADMDALAKEVDENLSVLDTTFGKDDTLVDEKVKEAVKNLKDGELCGEVVEGENGYYVVRMDSVLDRGATDQEKLSIVNERKQEAYNDLIEDWEKDTKLTVDEKEWKKVTLTDADQYTIKQPEVETEEPVETQVDKDAEDKTKESTETAE